MVELVFVRDYARAMLRCMTCCIYRYLLISYISRICAFARAVGCSMPVCHKKPILVNISTVFGSLIFLFMLIFPIILAELFPDLSGKLVRWYLMQVPLLPEITLQNFRYAQDGISNEFATMWISIRVIVQIQSAVACLLFFVFRKVAFSQIYSVSGFKIGESRSTTLVILLCILVLSLYLVYFCGFYSELSIDSYGWSLNPVGLAFYILCGIMVSLIPAVLWGIMRSSHD